MPKSLKIAQLVQILGLPEDALYDCIVNWDDQFGFEIGQEVVYFGTGKKDDFISELDKQFANWGKVVQAKDGKV